MIVTGPLAILAILSALGGLIGLPAWLGHNYFEEFLEPSFHTAYRAQSHTEAHGHALEIALTVLVVGLALAAMYFAYQVFVKNPKRAEQIAIRFPTAYRLMLNKFYVDEIYDAAIIWPIERLSRSFLWKGIDVGIIDGAVNGVASLMQRWSNRVKRLQSGYARAYASWILFGAVLISLYYYFAS